MSAPFAPRSLRGLGLFDTPAQHEQVQAHEHALWVGVGMLRWAIASGRLEQADTALIYDRAGAA
jgi:hypothetical protein